MLNVVQRLELPVVDLQMVLVEFQHVSVEIFILKVSDTCFLIFDLLDELVVPLLLELHVLLVFTSRCHRHHVLRDEYLHVHRVEVLLVCKQISEPRLGVLNLLELDKQHVGEGLHVTPHIVLSDSFVQLILEGF